MKKYIVVMHHWFVNSKGFTTKEIEAENEVAAVEKASSIAWDKTEDFCKTAFKVFPVSQALEIELPRRLTWRERITGWSK